MRCQSCDVCLSDYESSIKSDIGGVYLDLCRVCLETIPEVTYTGNELLLYAEDQGDPLDDE
jgi:hypothetical protein